MSRSIQTIDKFVRKPDDKRPDHRLNDYINEGYKDDMNELVDRASSLNPDRVPVTLIFKGNAKSGLEVDVNCENKELQQVIDQNLKRLIEEQENRF